MSLKRVFIAALLATQCIVASAAHADKASEIEAVVEQGFRAFDLNGDGTIRPNEAVAQGTQIFLAMDANSDGVVSVEEFQKFSMGFGPLAEKFAAKAKYDATRAAIFKRWAAGKARMTKAEMIAGMRNEFARAASKQNAVLTRIDMADFKKVRFITEMSDSLK